MKRQLVLLILTLLLVAPVLADPLQPLRPDGAPPLTEKIKVRMLTSNGELLIEVYPQAAPNASHRFLELVDAGFFDNTPIFRVVKRPRPFVAQFGINWRAPHREYRERPFDDDPSLFRLSRGTLCFAKAGPNTNSTQVFINYTNNTHLTVPSYNFTAFGQVVSGMEFADTWPSVGDPGGGLEQDRLWSNGASYLKALPEQPAMILKMERWTPPPEKPTPAVEPSPKPEPSSD